MPPYDTSPIQEVPRRGQAAPLLLGRAPSRRSEVRAYEKL